MWRSMVLAALLAALVAALGLSASAQDGTPAPLDRERLELACEANAASDEDLATCLDVVRRILTPDDEADPVTDEAEPPALGFEPVRLEGRGDRVARFDIPADAAAIADVTYSGRGNFAVWSLAEDGSTNRLLVNEIGRYSGTVLFDEREDEHSVALRVEARGNWEIVVKPVSAARRWDATDTLTGRGDDVVIIFAPVVGLATSRLEHRGQGNFAVWIYTEDGRRDLVVNEIGRYDGEILVRAGAILLRVEADGRWSMSPPE
jgi:hypothetical protein